MTPQQIIYNQCRADGLPDQLAKLVVAQASFETASNGIPFNSNVFRTCNNCFGYKWVGQKTAAGACLQSPEGDYYARYNSIAESAHELTQWIRRRQKEGKFPADLSSIHTPEDYAYYLKQGGFYGVSVAHYANGLAHWLGPVLNLSLTYRPSEGIGFLLLTLVAVGYAFRRHLFFSNPLFIFV
jgi:hypothetical protein